MYTFKYYWCTIGVVLVYYGCVTGVLRGCYFGYAYTHIVERRAPGVLAAGTALLRLASALSGL